MALTRITKGVIKPNENYQAGIVTATGLDVNGNADISGDLNVEGILTYEDVTSIDAVGIITAQKGIHVGAGVSAVGVGTFGSLDIGGDIDVDGHTNLDNVSIAGVVTATTFVGNGDFVELDVDGHTNLDNVNVAGVSTFAGDVVIADSIVHDGDPNTKIRFPSADNIRFEVGGTQAVHVLPESAGSGGPRIGLNINNPTGMLHIYGANPPVRIQNSNDSANLQFGMWDGSHIMFQASNRTLKFATETTDHMVFNTGGLAGSYERLRITSGGTINIGGNYSHTGSKLQVTGNSTFTGNIDANGDIDVDGHTNLDNVSIAGVTTFSEDVKFTGATSGRDIVFDRSDNQLEFAPNAKAHFGGSYPLTIYNNINSYISQSYQAALFIEAKDLQIYGSGGGYNYPIFLARNGIIELGYQPSGGSGSIQLKTSAKGITVGTGVTIETNGQATFTGIVTASTYYGDGSNLTGITQTTISGNANNRIITGSGTANTLNGESTFTYDGDGLLSMTSTSGAAEFTIVGPNNTDSGIYFNDGSNDGALIYDHSSRQLKFRAGGHTRMYFAGGNDSNNNVIYLVNNSYDDGVLQYWNGGLYLKTGSSNGDRVISFSTAGTQRLVIDPDGDLGLGDTNPNIRLTVVDSGTENLVRLGRSDASGHASHTVNVKASKDFYHNFKMEASSYNLDCYNGSAMIDAFKVHNTGYAEFAGANDIRLTLGSYGTAGSNGANWLRGVGNSLYYNAGAGSHLWEIAGAEHMQLRSDGNLYLRSESANYVVMGSSGDATSGGITNNMNWIRGNGTNTQYNTAGGFHAWEVSGSQKMVLSAGGDLGINATNPASRLSIYDADGHNLTLSSHNWSGEARIGFTGGAAGVTGYANGSTAGAIGVTASAPGGQAVGYMSFYTNQGDNLQERIRINRYGGLKLFNSSSNISGTDTGALFYNTLEKRVKVYNGNTWTNTDIASDPYWSNVVLLIAGASSLTDAAGRHTLSLNGNAQTSTNHTSPVGNSHTIRLCSGGSGDYLNVQSNLGDFRMDDSDWTFEYWVKIVDTATSYYHIFTNDGQNNRGTFKGYSPGSSITSMYFYSSQGNGLNHNTSSSFAHNAWMHVAWEFDDSADDFRLYIGGVLKQTNTNMTFQGGNPSYAYFGRNTDQTNESQEFYIDNIRWTRGVCRYNGSNFTPPTTPYPTS